MPASAFCESQRSPKGIGSAPAQGADLAAPEEHGGERAEQQTAQRVDLYPGNIGAGRHAEVPREFERIEQCAHSVGELRQGDEDDEIKADGAGDRCHGVAPVVNSRMAEATAFVASISRQ